MFTVKELRLALVIIGLAIAISAISFIVYGLDNHYSKDNKVIQPAVAECQDKGTAHVVIIQNNSANPQHTSATLCDTLTITNSDNRERLIAFGPHDDHQPYDGITEKVLDKGQDLTITLNQAGTYHFHDHIGDVAQGDFTVN